MSKWLKRLAAALAVCIAVGATGCSLIFGNSETDDTAETADTADAPQEEEEIIKIGYIFNGDTESGTTAELNNQRIAAAGHSNVETEYIENVTVSDFENAAKTLIDDGCTYIVSGSPVFLNALTSTAGKYMNINFVSYGAYVRSVNIYAYTELPYQAAYAAGMVAAYNSETEKIGIVADPDLLYAIPVVNAAALGMQLVYDDAEMNVAFATSDTDIHSAIDALINAGCDTVICYTESAESAEYCNRSGIKFVGNINYGTSAADYENMLMYFYTSRDSFYLSQFKQITLDRWEADSYVGSMSNGVVSLSEALSAAKDGTQDILDALIPKITGGQAQIFSGELKDTNGSIRYMQYSSMQDSEIYNMDWYVLGVNLMGDFRQYRTELEVNSFEIKQ